MRGEEWRAEVERAQASNAAQQRRRRVTSPARGAQAVTQVGMVRLSPAGPKAAVGMTDQSPTGAD
jgi:hypothetical protein